MPTTWNHWRRMCGGAWPPLSPACRSRTAPAASNASYGHPDLLNEAVARLHAYAEAGADMLFAPGVRRKGDISSLVNALRPYPVNVLVSTDIGLTVTDLAELGVRRISVGSALSRVAWGAFLRATRRLAGNGGFEGLADAATFDELNEMFSQP